MTNQIRKDTIVQNVQNLLGALHEDDSCILFHQRQVHDIGQQAAVQERATGCQTHRYKEDQ